MKKSILLVGLVPVIFGAIGFGAGIMLKPDPATSAVTAPAPAHPSAGEVLDRLAEEAPQPELAPEVPPAPHLAPDGDTNASPHPAPDMAQAGHDPAAEAVDDSKIVQVGRISVPVYKPGSVTYVVADFGVAVEDQTHVALYSVAENATRLRDAILTSMHRVAETPMLKGAAIDSDELAGILAADLKPEFAGIKSVLFLSLHKRDVPRG